MPTQKLPNYLRTYRKREGFSQGEVAYLLGCQSGAKVSRYERFARQPTLETALAYEAIFQTPASELFSGVFQKVEGKTSKRAKLLARKVARSNSDRMTSRKLEILGAISSAQATRLEENS